MVSTGERVLAVDLGTTKTRAAYTSPDHPEQVLVEVPPDYANWLPSSVARDPDVGGWVAGRDAERLRVGWSKDFFQNAKRLLGQTQPHYIDEHPFSILEIVAQPLIYAATLARAQASHVFDRLALAAPVEWEGYRCDLLLQAGEMAGFPPSAISLTTEADAAARAVLGRTPPEGIWLLFDMGGGTLDIAVLQVKPKTKPLQILATLGTEDVSGYVLDTAIMNHLLATHGSELVPSGEDRVPEGDTAQWRESLLRDAAELAKTGVTSRSPGRATLPEPQVRIVLQPDELRELAAPIMELALKKCEETLQKAGLQWEQLTAIVCAGGSTRSPIIRDFLAAKCTVRDADGTPELAIVRGLLVPPGR
jgi:molecular chaperone DnaK